MSAPTVFVIKNQAGLFLNKQLEWIEAGDGHTLYRTAHRDEAINTVFEVSAKDIYLRAEALVCPVDAKGQPAVQEADLLAKAAAIAPDEPTHIADIGDEPAAIERSAEPESPGKPADHEPATTQPGEPLDLSADATSTSAS
jgi:hypothetical protein